MQKIIGLGNALVDILMLIESNSTLERLGFPMGSMQLIDEVKLQDINRITLSLGKTMTPGGSAANTIRGLAKMGVPVGFIGKVGHDDVGHFFKTDMERNGVAAQMLYSPLYSGCCNVFVSPNGERTMCTHLGAASEMTAEEILPELFEGYDILHIEGYLVQDHQLIETAVKMAKRCGLTVSIDLASYNVVEENREFLYRLMKDYIDIAFANEQEAMSFTGCGAGEDAVKEIASICNYAVVKVGREGSFIQHKGDFYRIDTPKVKAIDTTGAGDLYAAGFLYAFANGMDLQRCGDIGSLVASKVIQVVGTTIQPNVWDEINLSIKRG